MLVLSNNTMLLNVWRVTVITASEILTALELWRLVGHSENSLTTKKPLGSLLWIWTAISALTYMHCVFVKTKKILKSNDYICIHSCTPYVVVLLILQIMQCLFSTQLCFFKLVVIKISLKTLVSNFGCK